MPDDPLPILACRPRYLDLTDPVDAEIATRTFAYEGCVEGTCDLCRQVVLVGPRQLAFLLVSPSTLTVCFRCVVSLQSMDPEPFDISSLGNPEPPPL